MICPLCKLDLHITASKYIIEQEDEETKLYMLQELKCRNRSCDNYDKIVDTVKTELPLG